MFCWHYISLLLGMAYQLLCMSCYNSSSNMQGVATKFKFSHMPQFGNYCCHKGNNNSHLLIAVCFVLNLCDGSPPLGCLFSFRALTYSFAIISNLSHLYAIPFWISRGLRVHLLYPELGFRWY